MCFSALYFRCVTLPLKLKQPLFLRVSGKTHTPHNVNLCLSIFIDGRYTAILKISIDDVIFLEVSFHSKPDIRKRNANVKTHGRKTM